MKYRCPKCGRPDHEGGCDFFLLEENVHVCWECYQKWMMKVSSDSVPISEEERTIRSRKYDKIFKLIKQVFSKFIRKAGQ